MIFRVALGASEVPPTASDTFVGSFGMNRLGLKQGSPFYLAAFITATWIWILLHVVASAPSSREITGCEALRGKMVLGSCLSHAPQLEHKFGRVAGKRSSQIINRQQCSYVCATAADTGLGLR